jgi:bacterioferritin-associated ferredoxin
VQLDDELCLCFHVTKRKVINFLAIEKPKRSGQMSECFGAGTGCGWCRPYLRRLFEAAQRAGGAQGQTGDDPLADEPTASQYAHLRSDYVRAGGGSPPPGATPIDPEPPATPT